MSLKMCRFLMIYSLYHITKISIWKHISVNPWFIRGCKVMFDFVNRYIFHVVFLLSIILRKSQFEITCPQTLINQGFIWLKIFSNFKIANSSDYFPNTFFLLSYFFHVDNFHVVFFFSIILGKSQYSLYPLKTLYLQGVQNANIIFIVSTKLPSSYVTLISLQLWVCNKG